MDASCRLRRPLAPSPLLLIPAELRLLIYEYVFTSAPPSAEGAVLPASSASLEALLTCRTIYKEARLVAFACTTHNLNWARPWSCHRRLRHLEGAQHAHIRHVALATPPASLYDKLLPFRHHFDHNSLPHLSLESLTIILDVPDTSHDFYRFKRKLEQDMVFASIWYFKNVKKVIVLNVLHREDLKDHPGSYGEWSLMDNERTISPASVGGPFGEPSLIDTARWRFELANFYDYTWKPWEHIRKTDEEMHSPAVSYSWESAIGDL